MEKLLAYHGKDEIKKMYVDRVKAHTKADQLIQGFGYWQDGKGCAVGCTIHSGNHRDYEKLLGIPIHLARLEDRIFERLPVEDARTWPTRFLEAPKVGADLSLVWPKFAVWLLTDKEKGAIRFAKTDRVKKSINDVSKLWTRVIEGESVESLRTEFAADAAAYAAYAYAAYAYAYDDAAYAYAYAAAYDDAAAAAAYAAYAYAAYAYAYDAAAYAYAYAAAYDDAAAAAAYDAAARSIHWKACSEKLLELMREAK